MDAKIKSAKQKYDFINYFIFANTVSLGYLLCEFENATNAKKKII